jgi:hypothetical protein
VEPWRQETPFKPSDETRGIVADAALALVETQLLAQVADDASVDGRATGLIGFNGALLAAGVAVKELVALGPLWPLPFFVVGISIFLLLWGLYGGPQSIDEQEGSEGGHLHPTPQPNRAGVSVGARANRFYEKRAEGSPLDARERLLDDLVHSFDKNFLRITRKRLWLQLATLFLVVGLILATVAILFDRPTNMKTWPKKPTPHPAPHPFVNCPGAPASNKSGRAASRRQPSDGGELIGIAAEIEGGTHGVLLRIAEEIECG